MLSTRATTSPSATLSPARTGMATTMAGAGARGGDEPGLTAANPVHRAVDLDEVVRALGDGEHMEGLVADAQRELKPSRALNIGLDRMAVQFHVVAVEAGPGHPQPVGLTA